MCAVTAIFNNTKVFPARLYGNKARKQGRDRGVLLQRAERGLTFVGRIADPACKIRIGNKLYFGEDDLHGREVIDNTTSRGRTLRFYDVEPRRV